MAGLKCLIGESDALLHKSKDPPNFAGKVVGLYFSAHWCPPCRSFTPKLVTWYEDVKKSSKGDTMEMIFISSDRDQEAFDEYYGEMPWSALPYSERDRKGTLSKKFKVSGIPTLVVLDGDTGDVITCNGREGVTQDPDGFPWYPKAISDILKGEVITKDGKISDISEPLHGKIRALYFSAHWCPPCRGFTPNLVKSYKKLKEAGKNFEIVFVSRDRSEAEFTQYYAEMPWLALPYGDKRYDELASHFEIEGIPSLIILDENNKVITKNGRAAVDGDAEGKEFPWHPKPLNMLTSSLAAAINDTTSIIYFVGEDDDKSKEAAEVMKPVAEKYMADCKADSSLPTVAFFYEGDDSEDLPDSIRQFACLGEDCPLLVVLDIPGQTKYIHKDGAVTKEDLENIVCQIRASTLETVALRPS